MTNSQGKRQAVGGNPIACANSSVPKSCQSASFSVPTGPITAGQWDTSLCVPGGQTALWCELEEAFNFPLGGP